jgi:hypothetical protein
LECHLEYVRRTVVDPNATLTEEFDDGVSHGLDGLLRFFRFGTAFILDLDVQGSCFTVGLVGVLLLAFPVQTQEISRTGPLKEAPVGRHGFAVE